MNSLSVNPSALNSSGWDVSDACYGSRFASAGHGSDLQVHQRGWVGQSGTALAEVRAHWEAVNSVLHSSADSLADAMRSAAAGFANSEQQAAERLASLPGGVAR